MASAFPDTIKWELPLRALPGADEEFEDLLSKLRQSHVRVCAKNSYLESELLRISADPQAYEDADMMSVPKECEMKLAFRTIPAGVADDPRVVPRTPRSPPQTPRHDPASTAEVRTIICELARQQQRLMESLSETLVTRLSEVLDAPRKTSSAIRYSSARQSSQRRPSASPYVEQTSTKTRLKSKFQVSAGSTKRFSTSSALNTYGVVRDLDSCRSFCAFLVSSYPFIAACSTLLLSYAVLIAVETELMAQNPERDMNTFTVIHIIYGAFFAIELLLRLGAEGWRFFVGQSSLFNWLDAALVVSIFVDLALAIWSANLSTVARAGPVMRTLRIIRVVRSIRLVRTVRHLHEFQKMAFALASSLKTLLCSTAVVFFVMFFFAVIFTQGAADLSLRETIQDLDLRYGDLPATLYTLFLCLSNGISWDYAHKPLSLLGVGYGHAFLLYIIISLFGVLNVVTSIFVESVIRSAQHHKDVIVQDKEKEKFIAVQHMQEVFRQVDKDGSGQVTSQELEYFLSEPDLRKYMDALDVSPGDTRLLFNLLDRDGSDVIDIDEFCEGCLRLKGTAKSIDVHTMIFQMKNFLNKWADFTDFVADGFDQLRLRKYHSQSQCSGIEDT